MTYAAILFDLDGTLIDSFDGIVEIFQETLVAFDWPDVADERIRSLIGIPLDQCFARFLPDEAVVKATAKYRAIYQKRMLEISPEFPGCVELLQAAHQAGICLAVVSNKSAIPVRAIVKDKAWPVDVIVAEGEGLDPKPAPDMLLRALELLDVPASEALYVGDSDLDARAAERAGVEFVGVTTGEMEEADFEGLKAVTIVKDLKGLSAFLNL